MAIGLVISAGLSLVILWFAFTVALGVFGRAFVTLLGASTAQAKYWNCFDKNPTEDQRRQCAEQDRP